MKPLWITLTAIFAAGALSAGYMWHMEAGKESGIEREVATIKSENARLAAELESANEKIRALESESAQLRAAHESEAAATPAASPSAGATPEPDKPKPNAFAAMFKDPSMRKMLAAQQAGALRGFYSDFIKQGRLTPDEADKFFQLLQDRQMAMMDSGMSMLSGSGMDTAAMTSAQDSSNAALKDLLGADRFGQYQDFEKTLADRIQIQQLNQQLGATGAPLQDTQSQALIQIMSQERASMPNFQNGAGMATLQNMSDSDIDQYSQQVDAMNQRVYNRALSVLTQPQLDAFSTFQKNMATAQVAGIKMAKQMFKGSGQ